ncbi:hydroxyacylglutathione hydrolase [Cupriavidus sp. 2SB]|uniref:hydroxyacylglutathione hydrolase n=1 Tax=Cupriavidus sp. 2SB TaxID=2502199 RepID=UPI0010F767FB|nr:hydroxyacylglutathione hydrolase [Cupriavidus sp. 2SB]
MTLLPLHAFADNYIWVMHDERQAWAVDPGDAQVVLDYLKLHELVLVGILITHHHLDHTGGVETLRLHTGAAVYGPFLESIPEPAQRLREGDRLEVLGQQLVVIEVPGHTAGHIAYYIDEMAGSPVLFCGDTLFSGGCGRLFEGTPAQMLASLDKLARLPPQTEVCCAHEYTLSNLRFAQTVEPTNHALAHYRQQCELLRANGQPTVPSRLGLELQVNPFLRSRHAAVRAAVAGRMADAVDDVSVFAALREWKNNFQ